MHTLRRGLAVLAVGAVAVLGAAVPASAHVTVNPRTAAAGGYGKFSFRVPNEEDDADTTKLEVTFPTATPFASVSVKPNGVWKATVDKTKLATPIKSDDGDVTEAVSKITWDGGTIKPGQFDEFDVSIGPLPDSGTVTFKAVQTYSDGTVVRWIDEAAPGAAEPDHPAPVLTITPAADDAGAPPAGAPPAPAVSPPTTAPTAALAPIRASATKDDSARTLGTVGIVVGALGLLVGAAGLALGRRKAT